MSCDIFVCYPQIFWLFFHKPNVEVVQYFGFSINHFHTDFPQCFQDTPQLIVQARRKEEFGLAPQFAKLSCAYAFRQIRYPESNWLKPLNGSIGNFRGRFLLWHMNVLTRTKYTFNGLCNVAQEDKCSIHLKAHQHEQTSENLPCKWYTGVV